MTDDETKAMRDALTFGTGMMQDGKHVPMEDVMADNTIKQTPVTGFPLPKLKPEGRTVCRWGCQYEELNKRNKELEAALRGVLNADGVTDEIAKLARAALAGEKKDG